nr:threonine/serine exporter family protein [uncultured Sellimonas sp.]
MNYKLLMDTAMLAGKLMLQSGAETYRVEDTMHHILKTSDAETVDVFVTLTGINASIGIKEMKPITMLRGVETRSTNLSIIEQVNEISRKYCGREIGLEEAYKQLSDVKGTTYSKWVKMLAPTAVAVGFAAFFGGTIYDVAATVIIGLLLSGVMLLGQILAVQDLILDILTALSVGLFAVMMKSMMGDMINLDTVIIGSIMPLVPGVAITNAVRDTLQGDYISGCARILEAFLKAASIAVGVGVALAIFGPLLLGGAI